MMMLSEVPEVLRGQLDESKWLKRDRWRENYILLQNAHWMFFVRHDIFFGCVFKLSCMVYHIMLANLVTVSDDVWNVVMLCSALTLFESNMYIGEMLLSCPLETLIAFDKALCIAQRTVLDSINISDQSDLVCEFTCLISLFLSYVIHVWKCLIRLTLKSFKCNKWG